MTDIFAQEGITFEHAGMASTSPSASPEPIRAPHIDMGNAPANTVAPVGVSELMAPVKKGGPIPLPPAPQSLAADALAGGGDTEAAAAPGAAPPQARATSGMDIFANEGIDAAPENVPNGANAFTRGVYLPSDTNPAGQDPQSAKVAAYVAQQQQQAHELAAQRFTPEQVKEFVNNPVTLSEAIQSHQDWLDVPKLIQKYQAGEPMDEVQNNRLNEYVDTMLKTSVRGMSWNGNNAVVGSQLPAGAISYIQSGNSGRLPTDGMAPVQPNLNGNQIVPTPYTPKTGETALNDFVAVTDKGRQIMAAAKDKPASTALKAAAYVGHDAANAPGKVNSPLISSINDLPANLRSALYDAYKQHDPKAQMSKMMTPQGWAKAVDTIGEDKAADIIHWYSPMTWEEHEKAQYVGGIIPISIDQTGNSRIDPRAGVLSFLAAPGDVVTGKLQPGTPEFDAAAQNFAMGIITGDVGAKGVSAVGKGLKEAAGEAKPAEGALMAPEAVNPTTPQPAATVDHFMDAVSPNKDQMVVDAGIVSVDGAKSTATKAAENILKDKGFNDAQASEVAANMTANEKEQFVAHNLQSPKGTYPSADEISASGMPVEHMKPADVAPQAAATDDVGAAVAQSQIESMNAKEPPPINDNESGYNALTQKLNYLYRRTVNVLDPIENAEKMALERGATIPKGQSPKLLSNLYGNVSSLVNHYLSVENFTWLPDGSTKVTGKSLKAIIDDFDNVAMRTEGARDARFKDFNDYLLAHRYRELEKAGEGKVKPQQVEWSNKRLGELSEKYGDDLHLVENLAQEVYAFQRRTLDTLVDSGVISAEMREKLNTKYERYVPLNRVFDEADQAAYASAKDILSREAGKANAKEIKAATKTVEDMAKKYGPNFDDMLTKLPSSGNGKYLGKFSGAGPQGIIQKLKGSEREAREPLLNIFERTHKAIDRAYRNKVAQSIDNLKEVLPEYIQNEQPRIIKKGKAEVKITHDPVLDAKLDAAIDYFGHEFKRQPSIKLKGYKNVLGIYEPMEKMIRAKLGANEAVKTHEVGHMLDYQLGLGAKLLKDPEIKSQLHRLAEERIGSDVTMAVGEEGPTMMAAQHKVGEKFVAYLKNDREVIANMYDAYVNAPELLDKLAPKAKAAFEEILDSDAKLGFIKDIKPSLNRAERVIEQDVWGEAPDLQPMTIAVYRNGERNLIRVSKPMFEAMTQLGPARVSLIEKIMRGTLGVSAGILSRCATSTVSFIERNVLRDQMDAMIQGGVGYKAPWDFAKGLAAAFGKTKLYNDWVRGGGKMSFMELGDQGMAKAYEEMLHGEGRFKQVWEALPRFSEKFEQATRMGLYNAAKRKGMSDLEAAMASLEGTLNFGRGGDVTKTLNQYIPFLNAGVQGTDKLIRTAYQNPKMTAMWGIGSVTIPTVLLTGYYLYAADEKTRREYLEIPQWQKDMFWTFKVGEEWRSVPKPFSWGYMFGSIPERMMVHAYHGDKPEGKELWTDTVRGLLGTLSPVNDWSATIPPMVKVVAEWQSNYNFFLGRNIYPTWMEDLPPEQRKNAYTSKTATLAGELTHQSPALIENTVRGLTGGMGGYALKGGDAILDQVKRWNGETVAEKPISDADNILMQGFTIRYPIGSNSNSVQGFYDNFKKSKQAYLGQKNVPEERKDAYISANGQQIDIYKEMNRAHKDIASLQKEAARVYNDTAMTAKDKTDTLKQLNSQITEVANQANLNYNAATKSGGNDKGGNTR